MLPFLISPLDESTEKRYNKGALCGERIIDEWVTAKILPLNGACLYLFSKTITAVTKSEDDLLQPFLFANFPCPMQRWDTSICRLTFPGSRTTEQHSSAPRIPPSQENAQ